MGRRPPDLPEGGPRAAERVWVAVAAATFLYFLLFKQGTPVYLFDDNEGGIWLDEAYWTLGGQLLYRDFFEYLVPGIVYFNAAVMWLLGPTAAALAWAYLALGAGLAAALHALAARVVGPGWRLLPPALVLVLAYAPHRWGTHKWPALLCAVSGLLVLSGGRGHGRRGDLLAGALLGASLLFTQDLGTGIAAGVIAARLTEGGSGRRSAGRIAAGLVAVVGLVLGAFALAAGPQRVFWDCVTFPLTRYSNPPWQFLGLLNRGPTAGAQVGVCVAGVAAALALLSAGFAGVMKGGGAWASTRLVAFSGLAALPAVAHRTLPNISPLDLAIGSTLLTVAAAQAMERLWRERGRDRVLMALLLAALAPGLLWGSLGLALRRQLREPLHRATCRAGDVWLREPMPELPWIERHTVAGEPIFVFPFRNGTYFLTHTRSATSFPYLQHREGFHTEAQIRQAVEELERARPRIGILKGFRGVRGPYAPLAPLFAAIERSYEGYRLPNGVWVLRHREVDRRSPPPDAGAGED